MADRDRSGASGIDPRTPVVELLGRLGPRGGSAPAGDGAGVHGADSTARPSVSPAEAWAYVRGLAHTHYENFSVLSGLVPRHLRDDFAAVYAFCRWADDLGDETGSDDAARARSRELLAWWRAELEACFAGRAEHPVFIALRETIGRHALPIEPFADLIDAFVQDQEVTAYETWDQVLGYCRRSANPVGRLVLMLGGYRPDDDARGRFAMSDDICTALQLTNFWQDVRRDLLERDRVYIPSRETGITPEMLKDWIVRPDDPAARVAYIHAVRGLVERTREMFDRGGELPSTLDPGLRPVVWLFAAGGRHVLGRVEATGCTTLWQRPRLGKASKLMLVGRAWLMSRFAGGSGASERAGELAAPRGVGAA